MKTILILFISLLSFTTTQKDPVFEMYGTHSTLCTGKKGGDEVKLIAVKGQNYIVRMSKGYIVRSDATTLDSKGFYHRFLSLGYAMNC